MPNRLARVSKLEDRLGGRGGQLIVQVFPGQDDSEVIACEAAKLGRPPETFGQVVVIRRGLANPTSPIAGPS